MGYASGVLKQSANWHNRQTMDRILRDANRELSEIEKFYRYYGEVRQTAQELMGRTAYLALVYPLQSNTRPEEICALLEAEIKRIEDDAAHEAEYLDGIAARDEINGLRAGL